MNKYQEALDTLLCKAHTNHEECEANRCTKDEICLGCDYKKAYDPLKELVDKATAKEGIDVYNAFGDGTLSCPSCKKPIVNVWSKLAYMPNYCHHCGQRFKWTRSDEE